MQFAVERLAFLLLAAAIVAIVARRLRMPYTVALVLAGAGLSFVPSFHAPALTKELLYTALLPPLIFEAALALDWHELRRDLPVIGAIATLGVVLATGVTTLGMVVLAGWPPITAAAFGVLIAATDPVSVVATFKETGVGGRLRLLVEAESLFNDGTAAVGLGLVLAFAGGTSPTAAGIAWQAATTIGGGIGVGFVVARALLMLAGRTSEPMVEITLTTVIAYAAFLMAEHFGFSGVLSTLTAGLVAGNGPGRRQLSTAGREMLDTWWQVAAFFANSIVFLLIGMHETGQAYSTAALASVAGIAVVMLGRAAAVYPVAWAFSRTRMRVTPAHQHLLVWGGLRGALALALALGLPADLPGRDAVVTAAFAVVAFSVLVQGLTMTPLLRHFGEMPPRR